MKRGKYRGRGYRERQERLKEQRRSSAAKKALGLRRSDVLPHIVGRRDWLGMRDYAPEENGPVRTRKQ